MHVLEARASAKLRRVSTWICAIAKSLKPIDCVGKARCLVSY
jgi:hypothetical protein